MTPLQARAARAMLNLDMKAVCAKAGIGKRTLTEFEAGSRTINSVTAGKLKALYISEGIEFSASDNQQCIRYKNYNIQEIPASNIIQSKQEYIDFFNLETLTERINKIKELIDPLRRDTNFAKTLITIALKVSGLNQKQMAAHLECSPAFVSAMMQGEKSMSTSVAGKIQYFIDRAGLNAPTISKLSKKTRKELDLLDDRISQIGNVLEELRNACPSTEKRRP